jgi:hypothetical protein
MLAHFDDRFWALCSHQSQFYFLYDTTNSIPHLPFFKTMDYSTGRVERTQSPSNMQQQHREREIGNISSHTCRALHDGKANVFPNWQNIAILASHPLVGWIL